MCGGAATSLPEQSSVCRSRPWGPSFLSRPGGARGGLASGVQRGGGTPCPPCTPRFTHLSRPRTAGVTRVHSSRASQSARGRFRENLVRRWADPSRRVCGAGAGTWGLSAPSQVRTMTGLFTGIDGSPVIRPRALGELGVTRAPCRVGLGPPTPRGGGRVCVLRPQGRRSRTRCLQAGSEPELCPSAAGWRSAGLTLSDLGAPFVTGVTRQALALYVVLRTTMGHSSKSDSEFHVTSSP